MKIVLFDKKEAPHEISGIEVYTERFYKFLLDEGHDAYMVRFSNFPSPDPKRILHVPYLLAPHNLYYIMVPSLTAWKQIKQFITPIMPDVIYTALPLSVLDHTLNMFCKKNSIAVAGICHFDSTHSSTFFRLGLKITSPLYLIPAKEMQQIQVFSENFKKILSAQGIQSKKILVLPNSVDSKTYSPGPSNFAKEHDIKNGILFLGRITTQKNPEVLLSTFTKLNPPDTTKLIMIGGGDQEKILKKKYKDPRIIFTGPIKDQDKKIDIIRACRIFVLPSQLEGNSLALLEAMSVGLTSISSKVGNHEEILEDVGYVIDYKNLKVELPQVLQKLLESPSLVTLQGEKSRKKILREYDRKIVFDKLVRSLENILPTSV